MFTSWPHHCTSRVSMCKHSRSFCLLPGPTSEYNMCVNIFHCLYSLVPRLYITCVCMCVNIIHCLYLMAPRLYITCVCVCKHYPLSLLLGPTSVYHVCVCVSPGWIVDVPGSAVHHDQAPLHQLHPDRGFLPGVWQSGPPKSGTAGDQQGHKFARLEALRHRGPGKTTPH